MALEFDDSQHYGFFLSNTTLTSSTGHYVRMSALVLAALRAAGLLDNMEDGTTPPATDKFWLDKNTDPPVLKEWDATGSSWQAMTFKRMFERAAVTPMATPTGTANALVVAAPSPFISNRLYSLTPVANNTGATTIQVTGVGTYDARYPDGSALDADEFRTGYPTILLFTGVRFEVLFKAADFSALVTQAEGIRDEVQELRDDVESMAAGVEYPVSYAPQSLSDAQQLQARHNIGLGRYATLAALQAVTVPALITRVEVLERASGLGGGAVWSRSATEPAVPSRAKVQDASGAWWKLDPDGDTFTLEMLGGFPHVVCEAETKAWYDACTVKPSYLHLMHHDRFVRRMKWRGLWPKIKQMLCLAGHNLADIAINLKSPGTLNATMNGTLTLTPGLGTESDGSSGYIALGAWNTLLSQNSAFLALSSLPGSPEATGYLVSSLIGSSGGVGILPRNVTNLSARLNGPTASVAQDYRGDITIVNRSGSSAIDIYRQSEIVSSPSNTSTAPSTEIGTIFRSGGTYVNDTARFFAVGDQALTEFEAAAFDFFIRLYLDGLSGVVGKGPAVADIGFSVRTSAADMADVISAASNFSAATGKRLEIGFGTYLSNARLPIVGGAKVRGVSRSSSIIRLTSDADQGEPVVAPSHNKGGENDFQIENMTLDGAYSARGHTGFGPNRPGASGLSTIGSSLVKTFALDIIDLGLHGIDMCNTGEWDGSVWQYVVTPLSTKRRAGVPSRDCAFFDTLVEHQGDDAITIHYSYDFLVDGVRALYAKNSGTTCMGVEADDGSYNGIVKNVYSRGNAFGAASKSHDNNPAPSNITFENITAECCYGRALWIRGDTSGNSDFGTNIHAMNVTMIRPFGVPDSEVMAVHITINAKNVSVRNIKAKAKASDTSFLYRAIYVSGGASEVLIDGFSIEGWAVQDDAGVHGNGDTIRVTGGCADVSIRNGKATGCGKYGLWDSGAIRSDFDNITVGGTGVSSSVGFWVSQSIATNKTTTRALKVIDGFATDQTIVA